MDRAVEEKFADPSVMVGDTTAQEVAIPHPNKMGVMTAFATAVCAASKHVGGALKGFVEGSGHVCRDEKEAARVSALRERQDEGSDELDGHGSDQDRREDPARCGRRDEAGRRAEAATHSLRQCGVVEDPARAGDDEEAAAADSPLAEDGTSRGGKIINLWLPELYSIVRGKVGKPVEFGLTWGIRRLCGGYVLATMARDKRELQDVRCAVSAVDEHIAEFGKPPRSHAYSRGGYSRDNITELRRRGVRNIGLAPRCRTEWQVSDKMRDELFRERAQVEGSIGTIKSNGIQSTGGSLRRDDGRRWPACGVGPEPDEVRSSDRSKGRNCGDGVTLGGARE